MHGETVKCKNCGFYWFLLHMYVTMNRSKNVKFTRTLEMFFVTNVSVTCAVGGSETWLWRADGKILTKENRIFDRNPFECNFVHQKSHFDILFQLAQDRDQLGFCCEHWRISWSAEQLSASQECPCSTCSFCLLCMCIFIFWWPCISVYF